jgi:hypothetical protein
MSCYASNRNWSDWVLPEIKQLIGGYLLETAPDPFDHMQATDLMMLEARDMRVTARVRRPGYAPNATHINSPYARLLHLDVRQNCQKL